MLAAVGAQCGVGPVAEEQPRQLSVAVLCGLVQRPHATVTRSVHKGTVRKQGLSGCNLIRVTSSTSATALMSSEQPMASNDATSNRQSQSVI